MTTIKYEGMIGIVTGLLIAALGSLNLPLPFIWGFVTFMGGVIAGLSGVLLHNHKDEK